MTDFFQILFSTVLLRPYVFIFLTVYLFAAIKQIGLTRTLYFTVLAYLIAFLSEFSSTRIGFPYGFYSYIQSTKEQELWVSNVPFMDSLSYTFLSYCSLSLSVFLIQPILRKKNSIQVSDFERGMQKNKVLYTAVLLFVLLDVIIDPVALRGSEWFLGQIYHYHKHGLYFGVPLSNFAGWIIVGFTIVFLFQFSNKKFFLNRPSPKRDLPYIDLLGPLLYFSVMFFNLGIAFYIHEYLLGICGMVIVGVILTLFLKKIIEADAKPLP